MAEAEPVAVGAVAVGAVAVGAVAAAAEDGAATVHNSHTAGQIHCLIESVACNGHPARANCS